MSYSLLDNLDEIDEEMKPDVERLPILKIEEVDRLYRLRVLPPSPAWTTFFEQRKIKPVPFLFHWVHIYETRPGSGKWTVYNCPRRNKGPKRECDGCEKYFLLKERGEEKLAKEHAAKRRASMIVVDRDNEDKGPQILSLSAPWTDDPKKLADAPPTQWQKFEKLFRVKKKDLVDPSAKGWDFTVMKSGKGMGTTYDFDVADEQSPLHADPMQAEEWINNQPDLPDFVTVKSEDELGRLLGLKSSAKVVQGSSRLAITDGEPTADDVLEGEIADDDWD